MDTLKLEIMDVNKFISKHNLQEVQSPGIHVSGNDASFDPHGLFSEEIFGEIASPERLTSHGWINLHTSILHPRVFKLLVRLKALYGDIMSGKSFAYWDPNLNDYVRCNEDDKNADTGYTFFLRNVLNIKHKSSESLKRDIKLQIVEKYKDRLLINKTIVLPAGIRDLRKEDDVMTMDEINKLYRSLISISKALPETGPQGRLYDAVKYMVQHKTNAIYDHITDLVNSGSGGKSGFFQKKFGARAITLATRNVISAADMSALHPDDPKYLKSGETQVPLFQAMKTVQPLIVHALKTLLLTPVFGEGSSQAPVIDKKTNNLTYVEIDDKEKDKFLTSEGLVNLISSYEDVTTRHKPVTVKDKFKKSYYLYMTYTNNDYVYVYRNLTTLKSMLESANIKFDESAVKPLTYVEMFYWATYFASINKHVLVTRYPITSTGSIYPSKLHLLSTKKSKTIKLSVVGSEDFAVFPHWPILDSASVDSLIPHPSKLSGENMMADKHNCPRNEKLLRFTYTRHICMPKNPLNCSELLIA